MHTTLNKIRAHGPCTVGWNKLLAYLGKTEPDDEPLAITTILDSNGLDDALWALRAVDGHDREMRHYACDCAERVLSAYESAHPNDARPRVAVETARRYADGLATAEELTVAGSAARSAWSAAGSAARSAWSAAWSAAWYAAGSAAESAARSAWSAAWSAAWYAAWYAAGSAAESAERDWQSQRLRELCAGGE